MPSPTQRRLTHEDIATAARAAFGPGITVTACAPMGGGGFGAVWSVDLSDGRRTVLKAAPADGARLLEYEAEMLVQEVNYLKLVAARAPDVPVAALLHAEPDFLFMTRLPGRSLPGFPQDLYRVRVESGAVIARLHRVHGDFFGYDGDRPHGTTWPDAFEAMIGALLADACRWGVTLPVPAETIAAIVAAHRPMLAQITTPSLLHFDLWDGNILAEVAEDGTAYLTGLVDGERYLWGDPIIDFVSPAIFGDVLEQTDHPFVRGYESVTPIPGHSVRERLWLYQLHLYLLMMVEAPSRGMTPETDPSRWDLIPRLVTDLVTKLS